MKLLTLLFGLVTCSKLRQLGPSGQPSRSERRGRSVEFDAKSSLQLERAYAPWPNRLKLVSHGIPLMLLDSMSDDII